MYGYFVTAVVYWPILGFLNYKITDARQILALWDIEHAFLPYSENRRLKVKRYKKRMSEGLTWTYIVEAKVNRRLLISVVQCLSLNFKSKLPSQLPSASIACPLIPLRQLSLSQ